tara:strand:- start:40 stop:339 length:300 start_codon:yes stop_codon:yes gene_type:complete
MHYYTNLNYKNQEDLKGTATIRVTEDLQGKFSGMTIKKDSLITISDRQVEMLWNVIDDGNCAWDLIVEYDIMSDYMNRDQFELNYMLGQTNFTIESVNC